METKKIIINDGVCNFCHFHTEITNINLCELKSILEKRDMNKKDMIPFVEEKGYVIPEWCPLKKYDILFKLEIKK